MSRRDANCSSRHGFTVSMSPDVARRQLRVSLGLMAGVAAVLLSLVTSTFLSTQAPSTAGASTSMIVENQ